MDRQRRPSAPVRRDHTAASCGRHRGALAAGLIWLGLAAPLPAADTAPAAGVDVTATWTAIPLGEWCQRIGEIAGCPVILDRRIDPTTPVSLACDHEPLATVLDRAAALADAAAVQLESTIRIVPRSQGDLTRRAEAARRATIAALPAGPRAVLERRDESVWLAGSTPRHLLESTAEYGGAVLTGIDTIPHDHFAARSLPPLSLAERIDLLLADFDRRAEWKAGAGGRPAGRIVPLDAGVPAAVADAGPRRPPPRTRPGGREVFTLRLEAPLDQALAAIGSRLGLMVRLDERSLTARGISSREIVRANVRDVTRDELLDAIVEPLGLAWRIDGDTLVVTAAE